MDLNKPLLLSFSLNYENNILKDNLIKYFREKTESTWIQLAEELGDNGKEHFQGLVQTKLYTDKRTFLRKYWTPEFPELKPRSAIFKEVTTSEHIYNMHNYLCKGYKKEKLLPEDDILPKVRLLHNDLNWTPEIIREYNQNYHEKCFKRNNNILDEIESAVNTEVTEKDKELLWNNLSDKYRCQYGYNFWHTPETVRTKLTRFILSKRIITYTELQKKTWSLHQIERYVNYFMSERDTDYYLKMKLIYN